MIESPTQIVQLNLDSDEDDDEYKCEDCELCTENCHRKLFGEYCVAHVKRAIDYYPAAMTKDAAKKVFIKWYNSAFHFHDYEEDEFGHKYKLRCFLLPPPCLEYEMNKVLNLAIEKHKDLVHECDENYSEWKESEMNLYGLSMEF